MSAHALGRPVDALSSVAPVSLPEVHAVHMDHVASHVGSVAALHMPQVGIPLPSVAGLHASGALSRPPVHGLGVIASGRPDVEAMRASGVSLSRPPVDALHVVVEPEASPGPEVSPIYAHLEHIPRPPVYAHLERLPSATLRLQGHHGGTVSTRSISSANQERFEQAYVRVEEIVATALRRHPPLPNFSLNLHDLTINYDDQTSVSLQSLLQSLGPDRVRDLEACIGTLREVAVQSGVLGSWRVGLHDKVRGATGLQGHGLEQRSQHVRSLPHDDLASFATAGWLDKLVEASSHLPPVGGVALTSAEHKKKVMKAVIKAEAGYRSAVKKLKEERARQEADCAMHPGQADKVERLKQLRELIMRLEKEYDAFAYHWAIVYGAQGDPVERAGILKDVLERQVSQTFKIEDGERDRWFAEQEGEKVADYVREAAALPIESRDAYIRYCHQHSRGPRGVNSTGFMVHVMKAMEDPQNPGPLPFELFGINLAGDVQVGQIFQEAFSEAHDLAEAYERDMTADVFVNATPGEQMEKLINNPFYKALVRPVKPGEGVSWGQWIRNLFG